MDAFTVHAGHALPLRRSNVDTDQIIPAAYLKRVTRTGFADGLFAAWRTDPAFVLNDSRYTGATVLLAGADFWRTVLRFFVAHPDMKLEHVNPIVDFIHANKFAGDEVLTEGGTEIRNPPRPDFSMKGRTLKSILRAVTAWHSDLAANQPGQRAVVASLGVGDPSGHCLSI